MPTILELFKGSSNDISPRIVDKTPLSDDNTKQIDKNGLYFDSNVYTSGTNYSLVKTKNPPKNSTFNTVSNFSEQELSGIRVRSAVDLNNPLIYGSETLRIASRSTTTLDRMKINTTSIEGSSQALQLTKGLLGTGLALATSSGVDSVSSARDKSEDLVNNFLGIVSKQIPSSVYNRIIAKSLAGEYDTSEPILTDGVSSEIGKALKGVGGNPKTIAKQAIGKGIGFAKDKVREKLFGIPAADAMASGSNDNFVQRYSNRNTKSSNEPKTLEKYRGVGQEGEPDIINLLTPNDNYTIEDNGEIKNGDIIVKDLIPFHIQHIGDVRPTIFRANLTGISETVSPSWSTHKFLGNPFNFYTYGGVERSVQFTLQIYATSKLELATNWEKISNLTGMVYPRFSTGRLVNPPIIKFRLGDMYNGKYGFIESLSYSVPDAGVWETEEDLHALPKFIDASITIKFIESASVLQEGLYSYGKSKGAIDAINEQLQANSINTNPATNVSTGGRLQDFNLTAEQQQIANKAQQKLKEQAEANKVKNSILAAPDKKEIPKFDPKGNNYLLGGILVGNQSGITAKVGGKTAISGLRGTDKHY